MRDIIIGIAYSLAASTVALSVLRDRELLPSYAKQVCGEASWMITAVDPVSRSIQERDDASPILVVRKHEKLPE